MSKTPYKAQNPVKQARGVADFLGTTKSATNETRALAAKLFDCTRRDPCNSGACPICVATYSSHFVEAMNNAARLSSLPLLMVTIVPATSTAPSGQLDKFSLRNHARRLKAAFVGLTCDWAVFVTDISFNEHKTGRYQRFWSIHAHGLLAGISANESRRHLTQQFRKTDAIPRPVKVEVWDGDLKAFHYLLKFQFDRRIGLDDQRRHDPKKNATRRCRAVRHDKIRANDRAELLLYLDKVGVEARISTLKSQLRATKRGLRLVELRPGAR